MPPVRLDWHRVCERKAAVQHERFVKLKKYHGEGAEWVKI